MRSALLLLILSSPLLAQPKLDDTSPTAISAKGGQLTLHGSGLKEPLALWSIPMAEATFSNKSTDSALCNVTFPQPIDDQIIAIRLATPSGISNPMLIAIDDLPTTLANAKNKSIAQTQTIDLPAAVEGSIEELSSHFYKFSAHHGKTLLVDVVANRIGSRLDSLVRLLDSNGKELRFCDDDPAISPDARFTFTIPADGQYILELRDAAYEGSSQHRYRLRLRELDSDQLTPPPPRHYPTTLPANSEQEPNDTPALATKFSFPAQLRGAFSKPRDRDIYQFTAKKDDHLLIRSKTRSIGSPCDLFLRIAKSNGSKLADSKTDVADEASLNTTIPEDGNYLLIVEELIGQGGRGMFYQLDVEHFAGFSLTSDTDKLDIPAGGQGELKIIVTRRDYKGPVVLSLDGAPDFIHLANDTIAEGKNDIQLKIKIAGDAPIGKALSFHILATATINGRQQMQSLSTYPAVRKLFPMMHYPPPQLDGEIGLGIKPPSPTTAPSTKPTSSRTPARQ